MNPRFGINPSAIVKLANDRLTMGDITQALALARSAVDDDPHCAGGWSLLSQLADAPGCHAAAIALARRAIAEDEYDPKLWLDLGLRLYRDGNLTEAQKLVQRVIQHVSLPDPLSDKAAHILGNICYLQWRSELAIDLFETVIKAEPDNKGVKLDLSLAVLQSGNMKRGLELHESRWDVIGKSSAWDLGLPLWDGEDLDEDVILLSHEQGCGDTIAYIRWANEIKSRWPNCKIVLATVKPLLRLMQGQCGIDQVIDMDCLGDMVQAARAAQWHCPLMSVLRVMDATFDNIPRSEAYIRLEPNDYLSPRRKDKSLRVGLIWATSRRTESGFRRCPPLSWFCDLIAIPGVKLFSLQHGGADELKRNRADHVITDLSASITDYADLARVMLDMDVIVSVDTGPLHLAGAIGQRAILLQPSSPCWRWKHGTKHWYPSVIGTKRTQGGWKDTYAELLGMLRGMLDHANL